MAEKHSCRWRSAAKEQAAQLRAKEVELQAHKEELAQLASKVKELEHQLALATKQIVGPKSERMPTPEDELKKREEPEPSRGGYTNPDKRRANAKAKAAAPVRTIPHPVPDQERKCPHCGEDATPIGQGE